MAAEDATALGLADGAAVIVRSETGSAQARVRVSRVRAGNVQMFFPEADPLLRTGQRDPIALVPDYDAVVEITPPDRRVPSGRSMTDARPDDHSPGTWSRDRPSDGNSSVRATIEHGTRA